MDDSCVCWPPLVKSLEDYVTAEAPLTCVISPFIQLEALRKLLNLVPVDSNLRVLTRWNISDLNSGVSDPEIFPYLDSRGILLYINRSLHSKIYAQANGSALIGSGNLTAKGMGLTQSVMQVETAAYVNLSAYDHLMIEALFDRAERVTLKHYERAKALLELEEGSADLLDDTLYSDCELLDLPLVESPRLLWGMYEDGSICADSLDGENKERLKYLTRLQMPKHINNEAEFHCLLKQRFLGQATVRKLLSYIREYTPVGKGAFNPKYEGVQNGAIREWLSSRTSSDRLDLASRVNNLECWLPYCKPEIEVQVQIPGRGNSRVFYWREKHVDSSP